MVVTRCIHCGKSWGGLKPEHCTVCHETFGGTKAGDMHRVGPHHPAGLRRCLIPDEMQAKGLTRDTTGIWRTAHSSGRGKLRA